MLCGQVSPSVPIIVVNIATYHFSTLFFRFQVDHIISLKHGGQTELQNLALACGFCNTSKGADLGTFLDNPKRLIAFYNPRDDNWHEHFQFEGAVIIAKTDVGSATIKIFCFNELNASWSDKS